MTCSERVITLAQGDTGSDRAVDCHYTSDFAIMEILGAEVGFWHERDRGEMSAFRRSWGDPDIKRVPGFMSTRPSTTLAELFPSTGWQNTELVQASQFSSSI
jgi:hypothetical protein